MISAVLWLLNGILSLKTDVNVRYLQKEVSKKLWKKLIFVGILKAVLPERAGSGPGSVILICEYGSKDPDPYHIVTDPEHCCTVQHFPFLWSPFVLSFSSPSFHIRLCSGCGIQCKIRVGPVLWWNGGPRRPLDLQLSVRASHIQVCNGASSWFMDSCASPLLLINYNYLKWQYHEFFP